MVKRLLEKHKNIRYKEQSLNPGGESSQVKEPCLGLDLIGKGRTLDQWMWISLLRFYVGKLLPSELPGKAFTEREISYNST